jgi:hypothetical protein
MDNNIHQHGQPASLTREVSNMMLPIVDALIHAYDQWLATSDSKLPRSLCLALDCLAEDNGESTPADMRPAIRTLTAAWTSARPTVEPGSMAADVPHDVWRGMDKLEDAHAEWARRQIPELESIQELLDQRVSERQICRIYGFVLSNGTEDLDRLAEEIAEPGKHTGNGWMAPSLAARRRKVDEAVAQSGRRKEHRARLTADKTSASAEDLSQLVSEGVSARQIALMMGVSVNEVIQLCDEQGIPHPDLDYASAHASRGAFEPELLEAAARSVDAAIARPTHPENIGRQIRADPGAEGRNATGDVLGASDAMASEAGEKRRPAAAHLLGDVVKLTAEGMQPGQVARALRKAGHSVTAAEVRELIAKA